MIRYAFACLLLFFSYYCRSGIGLYLSLIFDLLRSTVYYYKKSSSCCHPVDWLWEAKSCFEQLHLIYFNSGFLVCY